ncbi:aldose 1-epimerase family protein [Microbacterium sp. cx-55]|uniref:aldose 1-epimerase family protein n=1 Tax=Microbacterium sp. cx-55 TaxID=2875948 RepID=UPI001CBC3C24|nr:aldose 1-epimerase family protein [Microbacterium sp. cx-55]MBZ4487378.1 aldose 1-epimerase family protein [Microbacterium sp. cx-55]UGB35398.1 aldose 1-epimerase family protein [Microbacterium sp. cx-55]
MSADPTGHRFTLRSERGSAEIAQVGAALRALRVGDVDLVPRYADDLPTPAASGVVLVPWPNRIRDGLWTQRGQTYQLAISEPKFGNASHGLLRFTPYRPVATSADAVTLAAAVVPQTGYPFHLETRVIYTLTDAGITVEHEIVNVGAAAAPVAVGIHPYLCFSDAATADLRLELDAASWFRLDERNLPIAEEPLDEEHDLRVPRRVGDLALDAAFTGIPRGADGLIRAILHAPDGRRVELWAGEGFEYLQLFTTDRYPGHDLALAIEPMTAPADALNSGRDLRWLEHGEAWHLRWGITLHA